MNNRIGPVVQQVWNEGSGRGKAVASDTRGHQFKSSHWQNFIINILTVQFVTRVLVNKSTNVNFFFANLWWATTFYLKKCQNVPKCFVWTLQSDFLFENIAKDKIVERQTFVQKSCERESIWLISNSRLALTDLKSIFLSWKLTTTTTTKKNSLKDHFKNL